MKYVGIFHTALIIDVNIILTYKQCLYLHVITIFEWGVLAVLLRWGATPVHPG